MTFLTVPSHDALSAEARAVRDERLAQYGAPLTPLEGALLGNVPSFVAYAQWYALKDELVQWIGERAFALFCYSISQAGNCENTALFFRKILVDAGDDPDNPEVTEAERLLMDWGRLLAETPRSIPDAFYAQLEETFSATRRLTLLAFAGQMVAVNLLNSAGRIPLDPELQAYSLLGEN